MTTTTTEDVAAVVARLHQELAALGDPCDVAFTYNAMAEHARKTSELRGRIRTISSAHAELDEVEPRIAVDEKWRGTLEGIRSVLCDELLALPSRIREARLLGVQHNVTLSIRVIDFGLRVLENTGSDLTQLRLGELMREAGFAEAPPTEGRMVGALPWFGSLREVERRLRELTARRDDARLRLKRALQEA